MARERSSVSILWFKRDLRLRDHAPLAAALAAGRPVVLLYVVEPSLVADPHYDRRHWRFVWESVQDLNRQLAPYGAKVYVFFDEVTAVFERLHQRFGIEAIYSHQETGLRITYDRDRAVGRFCRERGVGWHESPTEAIVRGLKHRDGWKEHWKQTMEAPLADPDWSAAAVAALPPDWYAQHRGLAVPEDWQTPDRRFQPGGETVAHRYLHSFLTARIAQYGRSISKPLASRKGCSRLSPYLAWGCLSVRQVVQALARHRHTAGRQAAAFQSRLAWQGHFIQKFESECGMEFRNVNRGYDELPKQVDDGQFRAWAEGRTGYPLIDACMRCLRATGYVNFRMRAMLMSFLTHHLFQHWKAGAEHLARQFLDFEPGIHYAQTQMQAGMTGTNTVRIYNPVKQSQDHDPDGAFIRQWVPELARCPDAYLHQPWTLPPLEQEFSHFRLGIDYPYPIIDTEETGRRARLLLYGQKKTARVRKESERILATHVVKN